MSKLGIIGTAGRHTDGDNLSKMLWGLMAMQVVTILNWEKENKIDTLVSGGAAWADHVAVHWYLQDLVPNLILHLPSEWDIEKRQFHDTGVFNPHANAGGTANYYHRLFSKKYGKNSLIEIDDAIKKGAKVIVTQGFLNRNTKVAADSDILLAMTFGEKEFIKDGGTADTVRKFQKKASNKTYHFNLSERLLYSNGKLK